MSIATIGLMLLVVFAVCRWSGQTLAGHYQDRLEVVATLAVGGCVLGALMLLGGVPGASWGRAALALVIAAGLLAGYGRPPARER